MTLKEESALDDKYNITRPTSTTIIVDDDNDNDEVEEPTDAAIIDITKSVSEDEKHLVREAGQGGAVLGWLLCGPLGSLLLGFGSAYAIRKPKDSTIGKSSRSLAELTLSIKEKAHYVEEKHHFVKRSKTTIDKLCGDNNDDNGNGNDNTNKNESSSKSNSNSNNNIAFKTRAFIVSGWDAASKYTKENQLLERGVEETGKGIEYVSQRWGRNEKKVSSNINNDNDDADDADNNTTSISSSSNSDDDDDVGQEAVVGVVAGDLSNDKRTINNDDEYTKLVTNDTTN